MKKIFNATTNKVNYQLSAKLISVSNDVRENSNGTQYRLCTIEFKDGNGKVHRATASMWEKSFQHGVEVGNSYLTTINPELNAETGKTDLYFSVSHLEGTPERITAEDINLDFSEVPAEVTSA